MSEHKAKGQKLCKPEDGTFGRTWIYVCDHCPIEAVESPDFLSVVRDNLLPGDGIRFIEMTNGEVAAMREAIVLAKRGVQVLMSWTTDLLRFKAAPAEVKSAPANPPPAFVQGSGEVKWNAGKKVHEVIVNGAVVFATKDKDEAAAIARGDAPIPQAA